MICPGTGAPVRPDDVERLIRKRSSTTYEPEDAFSTTERPELPLRIDGAYLLRGISFSWPLHSYPRGAQDDNMIWFKNIVTHFDRNELSLFIDFAYDVEDRDFLMKLSVPALRVTFDSRRQGKVQADGIFWNYLTMPWYNSEEDMRKSLLDAMFEYSQEPVSN